MGAFPFLDVGFLRGDFGMNGSVHGFADGLALLRWGFIDGPAPTCDDAADADDSGTVEAIGDALYLLRWQFQEGIAPPDPGPSDCGRDDTVDDLDCAAPLNCRDLD